MNNCEDAVEVLQKALEMTQACYGDDNISCAGIMTLLANCYTKTQDYDQALEAMSKVVFHLAIINIRSGIFQRLSMGSNLKVVLWFTLKLPKFILKKRIMKRV